ncbi:hypothetical protein ACFOLL_12545 [Falsochrobactrum ovis]|uniref:Putative tail fiber protein gp53-like C-terminal domain-containing protein n=1 Tax=Falsochrobactrum ovis TaxID=1293442 RepID=A0A364JT13_9HYPH|nr:hypothetical protein [Falsochrobactrum ovis]RAK26390.1 hypothetical protein C7374_11476 [Falsochrobactrum ovis]
MATLSDYTSGTISLANGSTTVTGTGTLFDVAKFREGDTLQIQNLTAVIARVDSNTQLTLTEPWTGTTLTDAPYRARYLPDGARVTAQSTTLIELLGNGILSGLAKLGVEEGKTPVGNAAGQYELRDYIDDPNGTLGELADLDSVENLSELAEQILDANKVLTTNDNGKLTQSDITAAARVLLKLAGGASADQLPYFTGANEAGLTPLTAFARSILDDANGAAMWGTLGGTQGVALNGYFKLPNGLIVQWGAGTLNAAGVWVPYPVGFPNAAFRTIVGCANGGALANVGWGAPADKNGFTGFAAGLTAVHYIAVGW